MGGLGGGYGRGYNPALTREVRAKVLAHFHSRGIPRDRWGALFDRWLKQKGLRAPA